MAAIVALVLAAAIGAGLFLMGSSGEPTVNAPEAGGIQETIGAETIPAITLAAETTVPTVETAPPEPREVNILMEDPAGEEPYVLGSEGIRRAEISSITFLDSLAEAPDRSWDVSRDQIGTVLAWVEPKDGLYELYIGAEGGVWAPESCAGLFSQYSNVKAINFWDNFHVTSDVTQMQGMFSGSAALETLDLRQFDTSGVTNMQGMFTMCYGLTELDVSGFGTAQVTDMSAMFYGCSSLKTLDVSSFDTANVTLMHQMFYNCSALTELDVSNFDTRKVVSMMEMFYGCVMLCEGAENGNWSAAYMFGGAGVAGSTGGSVGDANGMYTFSMAELYAQMEMNVTGLTLGDWEVDSVSNYERFLPEKWTLNGKAWKKQLFK